MLQEPTLSIFVIFNSSTTVDQPFSAMMDLPYSTTVDQPFSATVDLPFSATVDLPFSATVDVFIYESIQFCDFFPYYFFSNFFVKILLHKVDCGKNNELQ